MQIIDIILRWLSEHVLGFRISLGWLLVLLLVAVLTPLPMKYHFVESITWEPTAAIWSPWSKQEMTGYFYSLNSDGQNVCGTEHLTVSHFYGTVHARSRTTNEDGTPGESSINDWTYNGGIQNGDYFLRYRPASVLGQRGSWGLSYVLRNREREGWLLGEWIGVDPENHDVVRCPYILKTGPTEGGTGCEDAWPIEFDDRRACEVVQERDPIGRLGASTN
jgi:hypothetical protein